MNAKSAIVGGTAAAIVIGGAAWLLRPKDNPTTPVAKTSQTETTPFKPQNEPASSQTSTDSAQADAHEPLRLLGTVQASAQSTVTTVMPGKVTAINVTAGATVGREQILVQLDDSDMAAQERTALAGIAAANSQVQKAKTGRTAQLLKADLDILTAKRGLEQAQIKLRQAELGRSAARDDLQSERKLAQENLAKAETGLAQARRMLQSLEELASVGGVPRNDLDGARTQVKLAEADRDAAQTQLKRLDAGQNGTPYKSALAAQDYEAARAGVRQAQDGVAAAQKARTSMLALADDDIAAARANLAQAHAGLQRARDARQMLALKAPISGLVSRVDIHAGETAQPGMPLVTIVSLESPRIEALVPARQISLLQTGQKATVTADAQPGKTFAAVVSEIARVAEPDGRSVRVTFRFSAPNAALRPGQTARITL